MPVCPAGHESSATDFCDVCGMRIGESSPAATAVGPGASPAGSGPASAGSAGSGTAGSGPGADPGVPAESCPRCGGTRAGRFCEVCGFDFASGIAPHRLVGTPPATTVAPGTAASQGAATAAFPGGAGHGSAWTAVVTADRAYYDSVLAADGPDVATLDFPAYCPERRFQLTGTEMRIGRRSVSRGLEPEIDLSGPPADPGVSHLHAVLIAEPDGGWSVLDPGSSNGTQVNGDDIPGGVKVPLHDGDRIHVGAWTLVTILAG
jgi:FHA domain